MQLRSEMSAIYVRDIYNLEFDLSQYPVIFRNLILFSYISLETSYVTSAEPIACSHFCPISLTQMSHKPS